MDSPAPAGAAGQEQATMFLDGEPSKTAAMPSDKGPNLLVLGDSKQQPGQLSSPTCVSGPRCSACSPATASAVGSPGTSARSSPKGASAAGHSKPPWNIGTKAASVSKLYGDAASSPTSSPRGTKNPSSPKLRAANCTSTAVAPSRGSTPASLPYGAIKPGRAPQTEMCLPSDEQAAEVTVVGLASSGPGNGSVPPPGQVTRPPATSPAQPPDRLVTSMIAAGPATAPPGKTPTAVATSAAFVASPRAVAGLHRKPGVTDGQSGADNRLSAPSTAASSSTASRPAKLNSNGNNSSASSKATSSKELGSLRASPSAKSQSAKSLNNSDSLRSPKQLQQQLASSSKGCSLKGFQARQAAAGAASASAAQKPRRSAVEAMLQKQFSTELDFELKVQQWRGKEAGSEATQAIATHDSAKSEASAYSLVELKQEAADTVAERSSQLSAEQGAEPVAATTSTGVVDVPAENPTNMVLQPAADRSAGSVTSFAVVGLETAGSTDADACCYFSTPRRGERDLFKKQRASIVGETDYTVKPAGVGVAAKQEQEQQEVLGTKEIAEQQHVQHQELEMLLPAPRYQLIVDKSSAEGNRSSSRAQPGQHLQGLQQHTDSNQQMLLQEQDSVAEVEELQQPMQQRMPSLPLMQQYAGLPSSLHPTAVQQVWQLQQPGQQEVYEVPDESLLDPIPQRWPSLPMLQEEQQQPSLLLRLPGSAAGGIDLGMAGRQGSAIEPPTPHLAVVQRDLDYCLKASNDGRQPSFLSQVSNDSSAVVLSLSGGSPGSIVVPAAAGAGTAAAVPQEGRQQQHRSLQYSTSGCMRISTDADELTISNVAASDDFTAAVKSFSGRYSSGLFATSGPCAAATVLPGTSAPAAGLTIRQQHGCTTVAATNSASIGDCVSASATLFDAAARQSSQQHKQHGLASEGCQASYDSANTINRSSSLTVEEAVVFHPSRRVSRHSRQVSMDGSAVSGSEAASLAAIAAELEDIRRSSHDSRMVGARPAAAAVIDAADVDAEGAADASSVAAAATSAAVEGAASDAAMAVVGVEQLQAGRHSRRVSHHSRQVSMDGCSNVSCLSQLFSEPAQRAVPETPVDSHVPARAATDHISSNTPEQPPDATSTHQDTTANTHAAVPDGGSIPTHATATSATSRQTLGLPLPDSVQDLLQLLHPQQGHSSELLASSDNTISPTDSIANCGDNTGDLSNCSSASGLTQSNRSAVYQGSAEGDPESAQPDMKVTWNQMYDLSLVDGYRDSDTAVTRTSSSAAEPGVPAADSPAVTTLDVAAAVGSEEQVSQAVAGLVTEPVDNLYLEDSLPPLEAANSLVCMGSSNYSEDLGNLSQEAVAPAVNSHSIPAAERDDDADAAAAAPVDSSSQVATPSGTIALLFEMKHLLQEDVAALRASLDSLGQPSPRVQQQQQQQLQLALEDHQQDPASVTATSEAAATATAGGDCSEAALESQIPSLAQAPLSRMQVPPSPSTASTGGPSISAHALPMSHMPYVGQPLSSRILQQLHPASPNNSVASSGRSSPALVMGNASITAVGSGRIPNQWGFAAAKLVNTLTSTTVPGSTTAGRSNFPGPSGSVVMAPQDAAAPAAAPSQNSTPGLTGVRHMVHRTLTSRVRSLLGDAAAADASGSAAPGPGGLTSVAAHQPGDGVAAMHVDASGLLQVVLQVQLPAGSLPVASSAGQ